jgi:hypothetical protein
VRWPTEICASRTRALDPEIDNPQPCCKAVQKSLVAVAQIGPTGKMRHNLSHSHLPSPAAVVYHGIHFAFLGSGSISFLGMNLIQPSLFVSFFSGTWPI